MPEVIDKIFNSYATKYAYEGVVYVKKQDYSANVQYGIDLDRKFALGGLTKLFTMACVFKLMENKKLIFDSKITNFLDVTNLCVYKGIDYTSEITLRQLLYQTSGIPDYYDSFVKPKIGKMDISYSFEDKIAWVKQLKASSKPGAAASYSSMNSDILAYLVEKAAGKPLSQVYREYIFEPLGLKDTYLPDSEILVIPPLYFNGKYERRPNMIISSKGSGGLISTVRELMIFTKAFFEGKLFNVEIFDKLKDYSTMNTTYGTILFGGGIMKLKDKKDIQGQFGHTGAFAFCDMSRKLYCVGYMAQSQPQVLMKLVTDVMNKM